MSVNCRFYCKGKCDKLTRMWGSRSECHLHVKPLASCRLKKAFEVQEGNDPAVLAKVVDGFDQAIGQAVMFGLD